MGRLVCSEFYDEVGYDMLTEEVDSNSAAGRQSQSCVLAVGESGMGAVAGLEGESEGQGGEGGGCGVIYFLRLVQ